MPLLVSYPRSGTNWIRYVIEYCTKQPTPGENRLVRGNNLMYVILNGGFAIDRAHKGYVVMQQYPKAVLVIRNYKECLIRQFKTKWQQYDSLEAFLTSEDLHTPPHWYIKNIEAFEAYEKPKLLLYYEDMVHQPIAFIEKLGAFLNLNPTRFNEISSNLSAHQKNSVSLYTKRGKKSYTAGKKEETKSHSQELTTAQKLAFDNFYKERYPSQFNSYLKRYAENYSEVSL